MDIISRTLNNLCCFDNSYAELRYNMELILTRIAKRKAYTIGRLSIIEKIDDEYLGGEREVYFCDTLEPTALELKTTVSKEAVLRSPTKVQKMKPFAIPEGRYAVVITWSHAAF